MTHRLTALNQPALLALVRTGKTMQTLTPVSPKPADTFIEATAALKRLNQLGSRLGETLKLLPTPDEALLDAPADEASIASLL